MVNSRTLLNLILTHNVSKAETVKELLSLIFAFYPETREIHLTIHNDLNNRSQHSLNFSLKINGINITNKLLSSYEVDFLKSLKLNGITVEIIRQVNALINQKPFLQSEDSFSLSLENKRDNNLLKLIGEENYQLIEELLGLEEKRYDFVSYLEVANKISPIMHPIFHKEKELGINKDSGFKVDEELKSILIENGIQYRDLIFYLTINHIFSNNTVVKEDHFSENTNSLFSPKNATLSYFGSLLSEILNLYPLMYNTKTMADVSTYVQKEVKKAYPQAVFFTIGEYSRFSIYNANNEKICDIHNIPRPLETKRFLL